MLRRIVLFTIAALVCFIAQAVAQGSKGGTKAIFTGLDVVILLDQSGSMYGHPTFHPKPNDRFNHRIGQTKNIIYRLAEQVEKTPFTHKVAVVDFGNAASLAFHDLTLKYDPADPGAAIREAKRVVEIGVTAKAGDDWVNTNTPAGFTLGLQEFDRMAGEEPKDGRRRVLLLITDGRPYVTGQTNEEMQTAISHKVDQMKARGVSLWVIGINDADNYWNEKDGAFWESITEPKQARLADSATSIFSVVQSVVDEWLNTTSFAPVDETYECPPYLGKIIFNVNFSAPRSPISVEDPSGAAIPLSSGGPSSSPGTMAHFQIESPVAGTYRIIKDPKLGYRISVMEFAPDIRRINPARAVALGAETQVVFQVSDARGGPFVPDSAWPLTASVIVTDPANNTTVIPASPAKDGKFVAVWRPLSEGAHQVRLKGEVTLKSGRVADVFQSDAHSYDANVQVEQLTPYWLRMETPSPTGSLRVFSPNTASRIAFSLIDKDGNRVANPESVANDPATWLTLELLDDSGVRTGGPPVALAPQSDGMFEAEIPVKLDWLAGEGWWEQGRINLRVIQQPERMTGDGLLDSIQLPLEADVRRVSSDPMTVGGIGLGFSYWLLIPLSALAVGLIGMGAWLLLRYGMPCWLVKWADWRRSRRVVLKLYDGYDDPEGTQARIFPISGCNRFNFDRRISLTVEGKRHTADRFRVERVPSSGPVMAKVTYAWQQDQKKSHVTFLMTDSRNKGRPERVEGPENNNQFYMMVEVK